VTEVPLQSSAIGVERRASPPTAKKRLYEIDVVRILTFLCVIGVHTTSHTVASGDVPLHILLALLHFTREVFFALTAFVLVFTYRLRPVPMKKFWPRRFLLVGVPYVVWSAIYVVAGYLHTPSGGIGHLALTFLFDVATGTAWYHLYFLLVTMQVYLLVPVILWVVRKTRRHHWLVLAVCAVIQLALYSCYMYWPHATAWLGGYQKQMFFSYLLFIMGGAIAADHSTEFLAWVRAHRPLIGLISAAGAAFMIAVYFIQMAAGRTSYGAGTPLQPAMVVWGLVVCLGFLALGTLFADRRRTGDLGLRAVDVASDRSFGIFLAHPLFVWLLLWVGDDWVTKVIPTPWLTLVTYVTVIACAAGVTELARRSPLSLPLTGRPFRRKQKA
jgi:peptidoglycan/LPS O-acetylase OafA/YrhL